MQEREPKEELFKQKIDDSVIRNSFNSYEELKSGVYASLIEYMITHRILRNGPFDASIHPEACIDDLDKEKYVGSWGWLAKKGNSLCNTRRKTFVRFYLACI